MSSPDEATTPRARDTSSLDLRELGVAAGAGLGGMVAMVPVLGVAIGVGAFDPRAITGLAELLGLGAARFGPGAFWVGLAVFVLGGMTTLPLLFVSLAQYLPPVRNVPLRGVTYGTIIWSGFVVAFYTAQIGSTLWLYLGLTLLAHWVYGYVLGRLYVRYASVPIYEV